MINEVFKLFSDVDYFAQCCANINLMVYESHIRYKSVYSDDSSEQFSDFYAIPKNVCDSTEMAISVLFLFSLHKCQEWNLYETADIDTNEWKELLKTLWIPEWFNCTKEKNINCVQVDTLDYLSISDKILDLAFKEPIINIVRYKDFQKSYCFEYICETETEYIMFWSGTTA